MGVCVSALNGPSALAVSAQLGWSPVSGAAGYKVYTRQSGKAYGQGTDVGAKAPDPDGVIRSVVTGLPVNVTNYFAVTCYNAARNESGLSNELFLQVIAAVTPTGTALETSATPTAQPTGSPMLTPSPTATPKPTGTPTRSPTATPTRSSTGTPTRSSTATPTLTIRPTNTSTATPTRTSTPTPARTATQTSTATPTATAYASPTAGTSTGPIAAYGLNEGSGTTTADASGDGYTSALFGHPVWTLGKYSNALQFSGGVTQDGVKLIPDNAFDGVSVGTIEAWVKFDTTALGFHSWFDGHDETGCSYPFELEIDNIDGTTAYWDIWAGSTSACAATFNARVRLANPSQWHHLAYVVSSAGNIWYVDGIQQTPTYLLGSATSRFFLGSIAASPNTRYDIGTSDAVSETFKGIIDEVRIYNRALTQADVQADMNSPL